MQYLVISRPMAKFISDGLPHNFDEIELKEQAHAKLLYQKGFLRQVWALVGKGRGAAVIFEANLTEHMQEMFNTFPLVKSNYADYQIIQLAHYPGFETNT